MGIPPAVVKAIMGIPPVVAMVAMGTPQGQVNHRQVREVTLQDPVVLPLVAAVTHQVAQSQSPQALEVPPQVLTLGPQAQGVGHQVC